MCPVACVWGPMDSDARIRVYYIGFLMELSFSNFKPFVETCQYESFELMEPEFGNTWE